MSYTINLTNGNIFATIADGTINTTSSMTLVGKNYAGYGQFLDDNFIHLLENGSNSTAPAAPLTGQLWWDTTNSLLKVYNGSTFKTISAATSSATAPSSNVTGDLWYDTTNQQVKVYTGSGFLVVGPAYTSASGTAGAIPETINDNTSTPHFVTSMYVNNVRVAIYSNDATFTAAAPVSTLFPTVYKGVTMSNAAGTNMSGNLVGSANVVITAAGSNTVATFTGTGANITGYTTASGNITGGNILTVGQVSATGNITGANFIGNVISPAGSNVSTTGNVTGGNILTGGLVSATGNVSANYVLGNAFFMTGINAAVSVSQIQNGGSNASIGSSGGNLTIGIGGTPNVVVVDTNTVYTNVVSAQSITKSGSNAVGNIGGSGTYFNTIFGANINAVTVTSTTMSATANVIGGNLVTTGTAGIASVNSITHTGSNGVGNIGSASSYFNQVFATATTALYADVAERFAADEILEPGTVVELGGSAEITRSREELSENVFGVISTRAAYLMNGGAGENDTHPPVAMTGRVPVKVVGVVHKGDRLVSAGAGIARAAQSGEATAFNVIGRSLVDKTTLESGTIEAIVTIKN